MNAPDVNEDADLDSDFDVDVAQLRAQLTPRVVDRPATDHVIAAMSLDADEPLPDVDECPKCGMSFITTTDGIGLTFPMKVICTCRTCNHEWERTDE